MAATEDVCKVGSRVVDGDGFLGTVRFVGRIPASPAPSALWLGVEWDDSARGKYDGSIYGVRYFTCQPNGASFIKPGKVRPAYSLGDAFLARYTGDQERRPHIRVSSSYILQRLNGDSGPFIHLSNVDLSDCGILCAGDGLADLCPNVTQLNLSGNFLASFAEIFSLLTQLRSLQWLNISHNPLRNLAASFEKSSHDEGHVGEDSVTKRSLASTSSTHEQLNTLILNETKLDWDTVNWVVEHFPALSSLHLGGNGYTFVELTCPSTLTSLDLSHNNLENWDQIARLGSAASALETLVLCHNPIGCIKATSSNQFPKLKTLSMDSTSIADWDSFDQLSNLPELTELNISDVPFLAPVAEDHRRDVLIAVLPNVQKLNRSAISPDERRTAERFFVRQHSTDRTPLPAYERLRAKHGNLQPLADISLGPADDHIDVLFEGQPIPGFTLDLAVSVWEFKCQVAMHSKANPKDLLVFHKTPYALKPIRSFERAMFSFRILDGDEIHVKRFDSE